MEMQVGPDWRTEWSVLHVLIGKRQPLKFCKWGMMFTFIHFLPNTDIGVPICCFLV